MGSDAFGEIIQVRDNVVGVKAEAGGDLGDAYSAPFGTVFGGGYGFVGLGAKGVDIKDDMGGGEDGLGNRLPDAPVTH